MTAGSRIAALSRLAAIRRDADLAALAAAELRHRAARARIEAHETALAEARATAAAAADPLALAALERFEDWSQHILPGLRQDLAAASRQADSARDRARLSFGRADILARLSARLATPRAADPQPQG